MSSFVGFEITLPASGTSPLVVEAYRIVVNQIVTVTSGIIDLRAREIAFSGNGELIVDGGAGQPKAGPQITNKNLGDDGVGGEPGNPGGLGGTIKLKCEKLTGNVKLTAKGGSGGPGQNGTDGFKGRTGDKGPEGQDGQPGGKGGDAGRGGRGGSGGGGGHIEVFSKDRANATFVLDVSGGNPGIAGSNGQPGTVGDKGPPGDTPFHSGGPGRDRGGQKLLSAPVGNSKPAAPNIGGDKGSDGSISKDNADHALTELRSSMSDGCLAQLLERSETEYYNQNYQIAAEVLTFVSVVSKSTVSPPL